MGAWFLGLGQASVALPSALTVAALASLLPLRFSRYLRMNRFVANVGALIAVAWSLRDFLNRDSEQQLLAIADMLIYLQIVLLFQERTNRVYWQLLVLSVLQVVVAAALNLGPQFALLLGVYMAVAISTLVLLCFDSERQSQPKSAVAPPSPQPRWQRLLASPEILSPAEHDIAPTATRRFLSRQVGLLTGATFLFTVVFFYATPRLGDGAWAGSRHGGFAKTGFSTDLVLEDSGTIELSNQLVMRVHFSRLIDRRPYPLIDEPYFHGVVLTDYTSGPEGSRWTTPVGPRRRSQRSSKHVNQPSSALSLVRQEIALESPNSPILFAVAPIHPLADTPQDLRYLHSASRLMRVINDETSPEREYRYSLGTMAFHDGRQLRATPHANALRNEWDRVVLSDELTALTEFDPEQFPVVARLAEQILEEQGLTDGPKLEQMLALQRHFLTPGNYKYSLNLNFPRQPELDPLEDFLANHHTGHCEYFASALALMLRSRGIPSRIVTGYRGGEFNSLGSYYQVRQKHSHAWVEGYLSAEDAPPDEIAGLPSKGGVWFRLDATPTSLRPLVQPEPSLISRAADAFDYVDLLWRDYVLGLNSSRQKNAFYDPLTNRTAGSLPSWMEVSKVQSLARKLRGPTDASAAGPRQSRSVWGMGIFAGFGLILLVGVGRGVLWYLRERNLLGWLVGGKQRRSEMSRVEFYRRLEQHLARLQLRRRPGQTPLEFARQAADRLRALIVETPLADDLADLPSLPTRIVAAYYQVRFGGVRLDREEAAAIERSLARLVQATNQRGKGSRE